MQRIKRYYSISSIIVYSVCFVIIFLAFYIKTYTYNPDAMRLVGTEANIDRIIEIDAEYGVNEIFSSDEYIFISTNSTTYVYDYELNLVIELHGANYFVEQNVCIEYSSKIL